MDQERCKWLLHRQETARRDAAEAAEILSHYEWRENDPGAQARFDLCKVTERFCALQIQYGDEIFKYLDSIDGQKILHELIRTYQAMRVYANEKEAGIDCEDDLVFLIELLHE